jgi:adenosylmethionine-8-amino-7-oxononanoate aminotransferase
MVRYFHWYHLITIDNFLQGGTYAGNAVACAAAIAVAEVMKEEKIFDNVNAR